MDLLSRMVNRGRLRGKEAIGTEVKKNLKQYKVGQHCTVDIRDDGFDFQVDRAGNVIGGNQESGIAVRGSMENEVVGNSIGTDSSETAVVGNSGHGIVLKEGTLNPGVPPTLNRIGGPGANANGIAFNGRNGITVHVDTALGNGFFENRIFENAGIGIDLGDDGPTANDAGDADTGANRLQNTPVIVEWSRAGAELRITYAVDSAVGSSVYPLTVRGNAAGAPRFREALDFHEAVQEDGPERRSDGRSSHPGQRRSGHRRAHDSRRADGFQRGLPGRGFRLRGRDFVAGILLGDGDGGFEGVETYLSGGLSPQAVGVGDFDPDGDLDLAVPNGESGNVGVLFGNGSGRFEAAVTYSSGGGYPECVAVGDFDGDGNLDLAVANNDGPYVGIMLGDGKG